MLAKTLISRPNVEKIVMDKSMGFDTSDPAQTEVLIEMLSQRIKMNPLGGGNLYQLSFRDVDGNRARALIEKLVGINRVATLNRGQTAAPSDLFRCRDGWIICLVNGNPLYKRWARLMGEPHWLEDPRFATDELRGDHGELMSERMSAWTATRTVAEALAELEKARVPASPVYSLQQTLDDVHVQAMGFMQPLAYPGLPKPVPVAQMPVKLSETPGTIAHRAPTLGEHTDAIMAELGYSAGEIAAFRDSGAI